MRDVAGVALESMRAMVGRMDEGDWGLLLEALLEVVEVELPGGGGTSWSVECCPRCGCGRVAAAADWTG